MAGWGGGVDELAGEKPSVILQDLPEQVTVTLRL